MYTKNIHNLMLGYFIWSAMPADANTNEIPINVWVCDKAYWAVFDMPLQSWREGKCTGLHVGV